MKAKRSTLNLCLCSLFAAATITLSACASNEATQKIASTNAFGPLNQTTQEYQQAFDDASSDTSFKAQVLLTRSQIVSGDLDKAASNINDLYANAQTDVQKDQASLVKAMLLVKQNQLKDASALLNQVNYKALPKQSLSYYLILNSNVNAKLYRQTKDPKYQLNSFKNKATLLKIVEKKSDRATVITQSNDLLKSLSDKDLAQALKSAQSDYDKGFIEYAIITRSQSSELQQQALAEFSKKYPNHPVNELIAPSQAQDTATETADNTVVDNEVANSSDDATPDNVAPANVPANALFKFSDGDRIAVLLPLSGRFAPIVGESAKLGILAALKDRNSNSKVVFYDTNKNNISEIVAKVQNDGTKLVIGPILKPEVNALNSTDLKVPSIVLNQPEGNKPANQWYFDLGPNYEGAIAASKIYADGYKKPVVIAQSSDTSSQRSVHSFKTTFSKVNANVPVCYYSDVATIKTSMSNCPLSEADSAYVNASVVDAVDIKAAIPSTVHVYLTDKSYIGVNNSSQELALKGSTLGDMPWLLTDSPLKDSFMQSLPKANNQVQRVFAAAYDSVNFALVIEKLAANKEDVLHGLSGDISLGQNGLIESTPMWVDLGKIR